VPVDYRPINQPRGKRDRDAGPYYSFKCAYWMGSTLPVTVNIYKRLFLYHSTLCSNPVRKS